MNVNTATEIQLLQHLNGNVKNYRKLLGKIRNFIKAFSHKHQFKAVAAFEDVETIDVSGNIGKTGLSKFKAPPKSEVTEFAARVFEIDTILLMEDVLERLTTSTSAIVRMQAKKQRPLYLALLDDYNSAVEALELIAEGHLPAETATYFKELFKVTGKLVGDKKLNTSLIVDFEGDNVVFAYYIDVSEYAKEETYLVGVARIDTSRAVATVSNEATVENRVIPAKSLKSRPLNKVNAIEVNKLLSIYDVSLVLSAIPHGLDFFDLNRILGGLDSFVRVELDGDRFDVHYKGNYSKFEREAVLALRKDPNIFKVLRKHKAQLKYTHEAKVLTFWIQG